MFLCDGGASGRAAGRRQGVQGMIGLGKLRGWLAGKKTYLAGLGLCALAVAGVASGRMGALTGVSILGYGLSLCGLAAKSNRQHKELLLAIEAAGALGLALRTGGIAALVAAGEQEVPKVVAACTAEDATT